MRQAFIRRRRRYTGAGIMDQFGGTIMPETCDIIANITRILVRELNFFSPGIRTTTTGIRCQLPPTKGLLIINISEDRLSWETIPGFLYESIAITTDTEWDNAITHLESHVQSWRDHISPSKP